jgi:hypothetical protein
MLNKEFDTLFIASQTEFSESPEARAPSSLQNDMLGSEKKYSQTDMICIDVIQS